MRWTMTTTLLGCLLGTAIQPTRAGTIAYIPGSTVLQTYDFRNANSAGWTFDFAPPFARTYALTEEGAVLGATPPPGVDNGGWVGAMQIQAPWGMSYRDSGFEMTFKLPTDSSPPTEGFEFLSMYTDDPRQGFAITAHDFRDYGGELFGVLGQHPSWDSSERWSDPLDLFDGAFHTMAMLRRSSGQLEVYVDGQLAGTRDTDEPTYDLQFIGIGMNTYGNHYMPFGSLVSEARAFVLGDPTYGPQWASSVIDFSSEWSPNAFSAARTLGRPDTSYYGDFETAWSPSAMNGTLEYVTVGYSTPMHADAVIVRETLGNGFVYQIDLIDTFDVSHTVFSGIDPSLPGSPVDFLVEFPKTTFLTKGVKIYMNTDLDLDNWEEIDAIGLRGSPVPEPSTLALFASAAMTLCVLRRRSRFV